MNILIEKYNSYNLANVTEIWNDIIDEGTSFHWDYHFSTDAIQNIFATQTEAYCAFINRELVGFYILHPNSSGRAKHIANALYAVKKEHRGKGIGTKLIEHSLEAAKEHGFMGMQYNSVVAINPSVRIYIKLGFEQVGIIKNGFKLSDNNFTDLIIFYMPL